MKTPKTLIFVVDDNEYTLVQIRRSLQKVMPCQVIGFKRAVDCLLKLHLNPDFILSDYNLVDENGNGMNGEQLLILVKSRRPDIPVMMYSSKNSIPLAVRLIKRGATDFLNSDSMAHSSLFAAKIARALKTEKERLQKKYSEKRRYLSLITISILFVAAFFALLRFAPEALPYMAIGFLILFAVLIFFRSKEENEQPVFWKPHRPGEMIDPHEHRNGHHV